MKNGGGGGAEHDCVEPSDFILRLNGGIKAAVAEADEPQRQQHPSVFTSATSAVSRSVTRGRRDLGQHPRSALSVGGERSVEVWKHMLADCTRPQVFTGLLSWRSA